MNENLRIRIIVSAVVLTLVNVIGLFINTNMCLTNILLLVWIITDAASIRKE